MSLPLGSLDNNTISCFINFRCLPSPFSPKKSQGWWWWCNKVIEFKQVNFLHPNQTTNSYAFSILIIFTKKNRLISPKHIYIQVQFTTTFFYWPDFCLLFIYFETSEDYKKKFVFFSVWGPKNTHGGDDYVMTSYFLTLFPPKKLRTSFNNPPHYNPPKKG